MIEVRSMSNAIHSIIEGLNREYKREYNPIESDMIQRAKQLGLTANDVEYDERRQEFYIEYPITTISREEERYLELQSLGKKDRDRWIRYDIRNKPVGQSDRMRKAFEIVGALRWINRYEYEVNFSIWDKKKGRR